MHSLLCSLELQSDHPQCRSREQVRTRALGGASTHFIQTFKKRIFLAEI